MEVYTLVGKSGTGKSFHAMQLCKEKGIQGIIDDGLFIFENTIVAGVSAKRSDTKIGAVKVALFQNEDQWREVVTEIRNRDPERILILGTSEGMVNKIIARLGLPELPADSPNRIRIEDITTEEERAAARHQRDNLGKHVIPAPALQLKHNFAGYFMDPLRFFRGKEQGAERTVVRPTYSYMGEYFIAEKVIDDIITGAASQCPAVSRVVYISRGDIPEAYTLVISIKLHRGYGLWEAAEDFRRKVNDTIEAMTAFNVVKVDVEVRGIS